MEQSGSSSVYNLKVVGSNPTPQPNDKYNKKHHYYCHVDHGKTTMIDNLMKQSGTFRENENVEERIMDSGELEKERGIYNSSKTYLDKLEKF